MDRKSGIPLVDLFSLTDQISTALPQNIEDFIDRFVALDHRSTRAPGAIIHHGSLQSISASIGSNREEFNIGIGTLSLPLLHSNLPFQLSMTRAAIDDNLEPASDAWQLNLFLSEFILTLNGLKPAIYVPEGGATPRHLLPDPNNSEVRIIGSATLRLEKRAGQSNIDIVFIDQADPFDPNLPSGGLASLTFSPPHFFIGTSQYGMTIGKLEYDWSDTYSPPHILEQNQGPAWVGLSIQEATFYAPPNLPLVGNLSGGVRNVLLGSPAGIQGEFELQFGRSALDPTTFQFIQRPDGTTRTISGAGLSRTVTIEAGLDEDITMDVGFATPASPTDGSLPVGATQDWEADWTWPDGTTTRGDSARGVVQNGEKLTVQPIEIVTVDGTATEFKHPEVSFEFVAAGEGPGMNAVIALDGSSPQSFNNIIHLGGTAADLSTTTLSVVSTAPGTSTFTWEIPSANLTHTGASFTLNLAGQSGEHLLVLKEDVSGEDTQRVSHLKIKIIEDGDFLVGTQTGVFHANDASTRLDLASVEATYQLSVFHAKGTLSMRPEQASIDNSVSQNVIVPDDGLAQVVIEQGGSVAVPRFDRHVQLLFEFEEDNIEQWGDKRPNSNLSASNAADLQMQLLEWASHYPGADFLVIGRCDDVGTDVTGETPDNFNIQLAKDRAEEGRSWLTALLPGATGATIASGDVFTRGETSNWDAGSAQGDSLEEDPTLEDDIDLRLSAAQKSEARNDVSLLNGWLIKSENTNHVDWRNANNTDAISIRQQYRRIDIYAVGGTPTDDAKTSESIEAVDPTKRRSLVPSEDRTPVAVPGGSTKADYRVKLLIKWDSPTATELKDAIPTLAEAEIAWTPNKLPLPQIDGDDVDVVGADGNSKEVLTVYAKWLHDARTGFTRTTLGVRSDGDPDGLAAIRQKNLVAALAFGPMLLSGVDFEDDVIGSSARMAALLAAVGFATIDLSDGSGAERPLVGDGSKAVLIALEAEAQTRSLADIDEDYQIKLTSDYVATVHIDGGVLGIKTAADSPMKIRYKNVGFEFDSSKDGWEKFGIAYNTSSMEVEDPGKWEISGVLGKLLRIVEIAMGRGSLWIEARIAIAMNIGIVEISEAIIRLTFIDGQLLPKFELRGFTVKADIPKVLEGEGRLRIEDGGIIRAGVEANIIPLGMGANAAIAFGKPPQIDPDVFLSLALGVQFSTPLPLASSGAALYGINGMFVMNGGRAVNTANPDPISRELEWWGKDPEIKYDPESGQYALGVGVVVGTMPDASFCFSASGMVVVGFPDPEVILGVEVEIISVPDTKAKDQKSGSSATITGLIVIDDEAVKVAVSAEYTIPKILSLKVPFGAYFPYSGDGTFVRLGSDGQTQFQRFGEPITLKLLPGTLDVQAWSYLMIEEGGLQSLGGKPEFSFSGFSVGFGAGFSINWSAGPIKLSASAAVYVGFGTQPLMIKGGIFVDGELDLVVLSISAYGHLILTYLDGDVYLDGEFCGEVDMFFFSIKGCVGVSIGGSSNFEPPEPEPPVASISLTDRRDQIMGEAALSSASIAGEAVFAVDSNGNNTGVSPNENNTVWPDTAPVLHFKHYVENGLGNSVDPQFSAAGTPSQPKWFGSNRLKYAYRIDSITLTEKVSGTRVAGSEPLQTTWMTSPYRQPNSSGVDNPEPSEHEGPNLKLLDWNPWSWVVNLDDGGESSTGDPAQGVEEICDPVPAPQGACVFGRAAEGGVWHVITMRQSPLDEGPYPSRFYVTGEPVLRSGSTRIIRRDLHMFITQSGSTVSSGAIVNLPFTITHGGMNLARGYQLPQIRRTTTSGAVDSSLPWEGMFDSEVCKPKVTLLVCSPVDTKPGGDDKKCTEFKGVKPSGKHEVLTHGNMTIRQINPRKPFTLTDQVNAVTRPATQGQDGNADIQFPSDGIEISFKPPCLQFELYFMKFTNADIKLEALGADGKVVSTQTVSGPQGAPLVGRLNAVDGIFRIRVTGGGGEAFLYRICCIGKTDGVPEPAPDPDNHCEDFRGVKPKPRPVKSFKHKGFVFNPVKSTDTLLLRDVVDQNPTPPVAGRDRSASISIPRAGVKITLDHPCKTVEVWVMKFNSEQIKATGLDAQGRPIASANSASTQSKPLRIMLRARSGQSITEIILEGGGNESFVFRICCLDKDIPQTECLTFKDAKIRGGSVNSFEYMGLVFLDLSGKNLLRLTDTVNAKTNPVKPGRDRVGELSFSDKGLRIEITKACDRITLHLMQFAGPVRAVAFNALGARTSLTASANKQKTEQVLNLKGPGITAVEIYGGNGEAVLFKICCHMRKRSLKGGLKDRLRGRLADHLDVLTSRRDIMAEAVRVDRVSHITPFARATALTTATAVPAQMHAALAATSRFPTVMGIEDVLVSTAWPGTVIETRRVGNRMCAVIEYDSARISDKDWDGFHIRPRPGQRITLLSVCATDKFAKDQHTADQAARNDLHDTMVDVTATDVTERREIVLEPGKDYDLDIRWSWQSWQSNEDATNSPPATPPNTWTTAASPQSFHFAVAEEDTNTALTQDGLNEFVFDARDVARHLKRLEPASGRAVHFTDDPLWVHFDLGHVEQLLEQYDREIEIAVRRTDPPPQTPGLSTVNAGTVVNTGAMVQLIPISLDWMSSPQVLLPLGYQRINEAVLAAPCLPDAPVVGGASLMAKFELEPSAMYDFEIIAKSTSGGNPLIVSATRFTTSRYKDPEELIAHLGYGISAPTLYKPEDIILPDGFAWPTGGMEVSDSLVDDALRDMGMDTLPLPSQKPVSHLIWELGGNQWRVAGILVDSLETLNREGAKETLTGSEISTRLKLNAAHISDRTFEVFRANDAWTRVLLKPSSPVKLSQERTNMVLNFETHDGALTGTRLIGPLPAILEREGF